MYYRRRRRSSSRRMGYGRGINELLREAYKRGKRSAGRAGRVIRRGRRSPYGRSAPSGDPQPGYWNGGRFRAWRL